MKYTRRRGSRGHIAAVIAAVVSIALASFLLLNRQYVIDQLAVWRFQPSAEVALLAEQAGMNGTAKFYFYASQPSIEDAASFNKNCQREEASTAVLGCYNGRQIYIYNVSNPRLSGIQDVTAAHEMLHVAYARLSDEERKKVDALLSAEYDTLKNDSALSNRVAFYDRTEPGERMNELHSILGTEIGTLDGELEEYYQKYFADRGKVVALHARYVAVFDELKTKSDALSKELNVLTDTINTRMVTYNSNVESLNKTIASFNQKAAGGSFTSEEVFEAERMQLVSRSNDLESERVAIDDMITRYESLREELTSIASQSDVLNRSIDSTLAPAPSV